jgi:hypothetical protein
MISFELNWVAVVVAAVATIVIGFVWYMPQVFGERWAAASGKSMSDMTMTPVNYVLMAVAALVSAVAVAMIVKATGADGVVDGAILGAIGWLGFTGAVAFSDRIFNGGTMSLLAIQSGYRLVSFVVMGAILAAL